MTDQPSPAEGKSVLHPAGTVVGIIDSPDDAQAALDALHGSGFSDDSVVVVCGPLGARHLVNAPERLSLLKRLVHVVHNPHEQATLPSVRYAVAVENGHMCLRVHVTTDTERDSARWILKSHGGHYITYHGLSTTELLDE